MTKTALKILGLHNKDGKLVADPTERPGTLLGDNNLMGGNQMVAASLSTKSTPSLV